MEDGSRVLFQNVIQVYSSSCGQNLRTGLSVGIPISSHPCPTDRQERLVEHVLETTLHGQPLWAM